MAVTVVCSNCCRGDRRALSNRLGEIKRCVEDGQFRRERFQHGQRHGIAGDEMNVLSVC